MLEDTRLPSVATVWHQAETLSQSLALALACLLPPPRTATPPRSLSTPLLRSLFHPLSNAVPETLFPFLFFSPIILRKNHLPHTIESFLSPFFFFTLVPTPPQHHHRRHPCLPSHTLVIFLQSSSSVRIMLLRNKMRVFVSASTRPPSIGFTSGATAALLPASLRPRSCMRAPPPSCFPSKRQHRPSAGSPVPLSSNQRQAAPFPSERARLAVT